MVVGGGGAKKGSKFNKTQRGVERQFTDPKELERESRGRNNFNRNEEDSGDEDDRVANPAERVIPVENPNRAAAKKGNTAKLSDLSLQDDDEEQEEDEAPMSRREREALQKQQAAARYQKLTEEGKTDQARADLARLAVIRKQREEAKRKKDEELAAKETKRQESLNAGKGIIGKSLGKK